MSQVIHYEFVSLWAACYLQCEDRLRVANDLYYRADGKNSLVVHS